LWACLFWLALVGASLLLVSWLFPASRQPNTQEGSDLPTTKSGSGRS
jgi:hypothetical protein